MDNTTAMRKGLAELEKRMSLRQIALQSGINYLTLRNIKGGETKRVSNSVMDRFNAFRDKVDPSGAGKVASPAPAKKAAPTKAAPKKAMAKKASAKKPGPKKAAPKKAAPKKAAAKTSAPVTTSPASKPAPAQTSDFRTPMLGEALTREIEIAEARLDYLRSLQMVEEEFLKAIGKK